MKHRTLYLVGLLLASAVTSLAQTAASDAPLLGRGRGGAPYAWNDKNQDGICDATGRPVGRGWRAVRRSQDLEQGEPLLGRGRGGAPHAWNDKNRDGVCDITGRPVGQGYGGGRGHRRAGRTSTAAPPAESATAQSQP